MIWRVHFASFLVIILCSCEDDSVATLENTPTESTLTRRERMRELEADLEVAKWENTRLSLKLRRVDGASLVRDKKTNLWHHDVERTPFKLAMKSNPECMFPEDPVKSYRMYYKTKQSRFKMAWTKRDVPEWFAA